MSRYIATINDENNDIIYPRTKKDAIIDTINEVPDGGNPTQVLTKTTTGYSWEDSSPGTVTSVNNVSPDENGNITLTASDVGADSEGTAQSLVDPINAKIPSEATSNNKLADKDFVNSSIENVAAYYLTKNSQGEAFSTKSELNSASVYYSGGIVRTPTRNDYCVVLSDESKGTIRSGYIYFTNTTQYVGYFVLNNSTSTKVLVTNENKDSLSIVPGSTVAYIEIPTTRYIYNNQWNFQYIVNNNGFTAAQWSTINSGLLSVDKTKLDGIQEYATAVSDETVSGWGYTKTTGTMVNNHVLLSNGGNQIKDSGFTLDNATTTTAGIVQLSNATNSTSTTLAATPSAVKAAYDHGGVTSVNGSTGAVTVQPVINQNTELTVKKLTGGISYQTTAPTSANTDGMKFVVLSSDPATKYDGWFYIITR